MKLQNRISVIKILVLYCGLWAVVSGLCACEGFARKFVRKPKPQDKKEEEIVLVPQEYKAEELNNEELYRQYFLYWKSWQDELIDNLSERGLNHKKQIDCLKEALGNLMKLRDLLEAEKQKLLDNYINEMNNLRADISKDLYENFIVNNLMRARQLKRNIQRDFSFSKIKAHIL
jgi:hypothetical protein